MVDLTNLLDLAGSRKSFEVPHSLQKWFIDVWLGKRPSRYTNAEIEFVFRATSKHLTSPDRIQPMANHCMADFAACVEYNIRFLCLISRVPFN